MKYWYANELSKIAQVSVRTLHHYDKIGLLKPSVRQSNNYRQYSEQDLLRLQQIVALKFFGFELTQIKKILSTSDDANKILAVQVKFLQDNAAKMLAASTLLQRILGDCTSNKSIPWEQTIQLIEVYQMTQKLENTWIKEIFTPEELKEYAQFEAEINTRTTPEKKALFEKNWLALTSEAKEMVNSDPHSPKALALAKKIMDHVNSFFGKKYAHLRTKKFEKGFGEGKGLDENGLTAEVMVWLEKVMDIYWRERLKKILAQVSHISDSQVLAQWNAIMIEMYGDEEERKALIPPIAYADDELSPEAKKWLKSTFNL